MSDNPNDMVALEDASIDDLRKRCDELGIPHKPSSNSTHLIAYIRQADPGATSVPVVRSQQPAAPQAPEGMQMPRPSDTAKKLSSSKSGGDPKVTLVLNRTEEKGGNRPLFVSVNGVGMLIPRGEKVSIPFRYYLALLNAVGIQYDQDEEGELESREVQSYPFNVQEMPPRDEIDAWHKAQESTPELKSA